MIRNFLILLLLVSPFFASSQVIIKPSTGQYFLEVDDSLQVFKRISAKQDTIEANLRETLTVKDSVISTYQTDSKNLGELLINKDTEIKSLEKEVKQQKKLKWLERGIAVITIVLILL